MPLDIDAWMQRLQNELRQKFGKRLLFLGLQGSRARGEARKDSDIDVVLVIEGFDTPDLSTYKTILANMPHSEIACGFASSAEVLINWPRYDSFNLVMDTSTYFGSLDFMNTEYSPMDAKEAAKAGASGIYHAICHGCLFDGKELAGIVVACVKSAFFVMRALTYARTGEYPATRLRMRELATNEEATFLDAYADPDSFDTTHLAEALMEWSSSVLAHA